MTDKERIAELEAELAIYKLRDSSFIEKHKWSDLKYQHADNYVWRKASFLKPRVKLLEELEYWRQQKSPAFIRRRYDHVVKRLHAVAKKYKALLNHAHEYNEGFIKSLISDNSELRMELKELKDE